MRFQKQARARTTPNQQKRKGFNWFRVRVDTPLLLFSLWFGSRRSTPLIPRFRKADSGFVLFGNIRLVCTLSKLKLDY
jgi:hypothetical protein